MSTEEQTRARVAVVTGGSGGMAVVVHYAGSDVRAKAVVDDITAAGGR